MNFERNYDKKQYLEHQTLGQWVICPRNPVTQPPNILYWRLSDLRIPTKPNINWQKLSVCRRRLLFVVCKRSSSHTSYLKERNEENNLDHRTQWRDGVAYIRILNFWISGFFDNVFFLVLCLDILSPSCLKLKAD